MALLARHPGFLGLMMGHVQLIILDQPAEPDDHLIDREAREAALSVVDSLLDAIEAEDDPPLDGTMILRDLMGDVPGYFTRKAAPIDRSTLPVLSEEEIARTLRHAWAEGIRRPLKIVNYAGLP